MRMLAVTARVGLVVGALTLVLTPDSSAGSQSVGVAWDPSPSADVSGYFLYYGTARGDYGNVVDCGGSTEQTVDGLEDGVTYFFAVTAYDTAGVEGVPSAEVSYTVPGLGDPPVTPFVSLQFVEQGPVVLTWGSVAGQEYQVLYKDSPADEGWMLLSDTIRAAGTTTSWTDPESAGSSRVYQIAVVQPPELQILLVQPDGQGQTVVTWTSEPGQDYQLLYKDSPADANWTVLPDQIWAWDTTTSWTDPQPADSSRLYQVRLYQPPEFQILSLQFDDQGQAVMTWVSEPGQDYQVLYKDSLTDANWTVLPDRISAWDTTTSWTDPQPAGSSRFYQVRLFQPPELRILSLQFDDQGQAVITWASAPNQDYQLLYKDSLTDENWTVLPDRIWAFDTTMSWTDPQPAGSSRFYWVRRFQSPEQPILALQFDEQGQAVMTWASAPGQGYQLLYKNSLADENWSVLSGTILAVNTATSWTDPQSAGSSRSYRVVLVPPEFQILSLQFDDQGEAVITWVSQPGQSYELQYTDSLADDNWTALPDQIWAWDTTTSWTDTQPAGSSRFYRVAALPAVTTGK